MTESTWYRSITTGTLGIGELRDLVVDAVASCGVARVSEFPRDMGTFVEFLGTLGVVLENYELNAQLGTATGPARFVNHVRFDANGKLLHHQAGSLPIHSARAWRRQRPRYFAMLMVDPGWQDSPPRTHGETILVRWRDAFRLLADTSPTFESDLQLLRSIPLPFVAKRVREEISDLAIIYPLDTARDPLDLGVRWKYELADQLPRLIPNDDTRSAFVAAMERMNSAFRDPRVERCFQLQRGELVVIDNHRVGHGRASVAGQRTTGETNPRELWSATVT